MFSPWIIVVHVDLCTFKRQDTKIQFWTKYTVHFQRWAIVNKSLKGFFLIYQRYMRIEQYSVSCESGTGQKNKRVLWSTFFFYAAQFNKNAQVPFPCAILWLNYQFYTLYLLNIRSFLNENPCVTVSSLCPLGRLHAENKLGINW